LILWRAGVKGVRNFYGRIDSIDNVAGVDFSVDTPATTCEDGVPLKTARSNSMHEARFFYFAFTFRFSFGEGRPVAESCARKADES
jgi:hypothetical protein